MKRRTFLCLMMSLFLVIALLPSDSPAGGKAHPNAFGRPTPDNWNPGEHITATRATRPYGWMDQTRSEVLARNGMVATSEPLATQAGLKILQDGGNAVDAAVAASAMLALVEPHSCGLGAELFAIVWSAKDQKLYQISANGWSPASWSIDYFTKRGFKEIPKKGIFSAVVPGSVDGWDKLLKRFGTMTFKEVLEPAAHYAEEGFAVHEVLAGNFRDSKEDLLHVDPDTAAVYTKNGEVPALYSIFRNPDMGRTFRVLQEKGRDAFYKGEIAEAIVKKANSLGAEWTMEDLSTFEAEWVPPVTTNYHGYDIWETPPPSQGWAALEMLNILEVCSEENNFDLAELGRENPLFTHYMAEAKKIAYSDLLRYNADPRFEGPPLDKLLSKDYAKKLCPMLSAEKARPASVKGNMGGGTIYMTTADRWGNMVSLVYSVYFSWGSKVTIPGYGFQLSCRGAMFPLDPTHPNRPEPHKRPFITIIAGFISQGGKPLMAFGNMGGSTQPQAHVQHVVNMIDLGYNVQATTDAARFDHDQVADRLDLDIYLDKAVGEKLRAMGHNVKAVRGLAGGYQGILFEADPTLPAPDGKGPVNGVYRAGSDLRKDGMAAGF